ncbi:MAG TPA: hypothetical protein VFR70_04545 [Flavobacterium sp.]|nr:hypothetical protein [Flavobacterium sp.]
MKKIVLFPIVLLAIACSNTKSASTPKETANMKTANTCPENANCSFEIIQGQSLNIKTDGIGKIYYELEDNPNTAVYLYKYEEKTADKTLQDAGYREEIVFEIDKNLSTFSISGKELRSVKMLFGVFCYCKGKAGYYTVNNGSINKTESDLTIAIDPIVDNQKITKIKIKK